MATLQMRTPQPLIDLGFTAAHDVEYIGPARRQDGGISKPSRHGAPGYSDVLVLVTGRVCTVRNDYLVLVPDAVAEVEPARSESVVTGLRRTPRPPRSSDLPWIADLTSTEVDPTLPDEQTSAA